MATELEYLLNNRIMGGCNHPDYFVEPDKRNRRFADAVCTLCGATAPLSPGHFEDDETPQKPFDILIPKHTADLAMVRSVLRKLESQDWRWSNQCRDGVFQYFIRKGIREFNGIPSTNELSVICSALGKLVLSLPAQKGA